MFGPLALGVSLPTKISMAGEGVPYEAQSEAFPDVPARDELGQPIIIINPSDWAEMFEIEGGVTGSVPGALHRTQ